MKPRPLKPGDTIGLIAPSSPPSLNQLENGIKLYEGYGLNVKIGRSIHLTDGYLAGSDIDRADDLMEMFQDPEIKGVFCAYGGYGSARMVEFIDFNVIKANPKVFWGYSDVTFLHQVICQRTGLVTFHGPMMSSDLGGEVHPFTETYLKQVFTPTTITYDPTISDLTVLNSNEKKKVSGPIVGGNLSLLVSSLGTPYEIDTKGKLLFLEDVGEEPYRLDRMFNQLRLANKLQDAQGIIVGDFHECEPFKRKESQDVDEVVTHHLSMAGTPAIIGVQAGHCTPTLSFPLGVMATIDLTERRISIEPGVEGE
ncbi:S66 peptidase family protein [Alkalicoccobacillus gibsonii]|uniref:S66 peptidase family protein n=1 Tax=Alkalicoccobacillus gibsonii TaxID=79881 RepID=UPI001934769A|nr:LD-carboxypeptidase [Alkalicoccobacillus gibsonii]MBM0066668.1 LD-carboxypeptidase [Alkalicoccobacillus gibsonii]